MSVDIQPEIFYIQCPVILGCLATDDIWTSQIVGRVEPSALGSDPLPIVLLLLHWRLQSLLHWVKFAH